MNASTTKLQLGDRPGDISILPSPDKSKRCIRPAPSVRRRHCRGSERVAALTEALDGKRRPPRRRGSSRTVGQRGVRPSCVCAGAVCGSALLVGCASPSVLLASERITSTASSAVRSRPMSCATAAERRASLERSTGTGGRPVWSGGDEVARRSAASGAGPAIWPARRLTRGANCRGGWNRFVRFRSAAQQPRVLRRGRAGWRRVSGSRWLARGARQGRLRGCRAHSGQPSRRLRVRRPEVADGH